MACVSLYKDEKARDSLCTVFVTGRVKGNKQQQTKTRTEKGEKRIKKKSLGKVSTMNAGCDAFIEVPMNAEVC